MALGHFRLEDSMKGVNILIFFIFFMPFIVFADSFVDSTGYELKIDNPPERIISLAPSITEELFSLGVQDIVVGVTTFCDRPKEAAKKEKIGTFLEPNLEKIISLKPDIIFATKEGHSKDMLDRLRSFGLKVFVFDECRDFNSIFNQYLLLGRIVGKEKEAQKTSESLKYRIGLIEKKVANSKRKKIFWQVGVKPLVTVGPNTFVDDMIGLVGGINIAKDSKIRYPRYNREDVIRQNPDIIILVTMGDVTEEELKNWQDYSVLEAVKQKKIYIVEARKFCSPTPQMFVEALEELNSLINEK